MADEPIINRLPPVHPGAILRDDVIPALGRPKAEIARLLGISRQQLHDILAEKKPLSVPMALRIAKLVGNGGGIWTRMQQSYDRKIAEPEIAVELEAIPTLEVA
jgi:addiction module HigA family antidote